jgi:hypothetical protein
MLLAAAGSEGRAAGLRLTVVLVKLRPPSIVMKPSIFALFVATASAFVTSSLIGAVQPRGGHVDWARLITPDRDWEIHGDHDPDLADFIRQNTNLDIPSTSNSADPGNLDQLCRYPFIYAKNLTQVRKAAQLANIREYLRRGGFICIDACGASITTPDLQAYFRDHYDFFKRMFPAAEIRQLRENHGVYNCYFKVRESDIFTPDMGRHVREQYYGLYGVVVDHRMVAVISMDGLECGWPQTPMRTPGCMKLILNIYIYAMTAAPEAAVATPAETPIGTGQ